MNKIYFYSIESVFPAVHINNSKVTNINDYHLIGEIEVDFEKIIEVNLENKLAKDAIQNEENEHWLELQQKLGQIGEEIALLYLKTQYDEVEYVATKAYLGYDIQINKDNQFSEAYEIKMAINKLGFHMSLNEIKIAMQLNEKYTLLFIKLINNSLIGYFFNSPTTILNISEAHIHSISTGIVNLLPDSFYIELNEKVLESVHKIDLTQYLNEDIKTIFNEECRDC